MIFMMGAALWLVLPGRGASPWGLRYRGGQVVALVVFLLGLAILGDYLAGWQSGSQLSRIPGRPSFPTGLCGVSLGLGVMLIDVHVRRIWLAEVLAVATLQTALIAAIGHLFNVPELYGSPYTPGSGMPLHGAGTFLLLSAGVLCARADRGLMAILRSQTPGGTLARRWALTPAFVLVSMGLVYLALFRRLGAPPSLQSWALFMTCFTLLTGAAWVTAELLHEMGLERDATHRLLEEKVRERTAELNASNEALVKARDALAQMNQDLEITVHQRTMHLHETISSLQTVCYNIAHDLRAPNRTIAGFAGVLLAQHHEALSPAARDCLLRIVKAAQRSDALTLDLLAYGRLGHANLPCSKVSLKTQLEQVTAKLSREISAAQALIEMPAELPEVWANPTALDQALTNLLSNAVKFVAPGVRPHVSIGAQDEGSSWRVLVQDNGIGIAPEHHQRIFGVFQRLHGPDKYPGTGIGLAIVRKSIERMEGRVGVLSSGQNGSCFWFELPKAQRPHDTSHHTQC